MAYNIADLFEHVVDAVPDRIALVDRDLALSFSELDERANRIAHHLAASGIGVGDHVGIYGHNSHEWVEAMLGCAARMRSTSARYSAAVCRRFIAASTRSDPACTGRCR